jgi:two-component system, OmpR family, alkaline phosphatase synthesis response regulator PhoP
MLTCSYYIENIIVHEKAMAQKLLVVDDEEDILELLRFNLSVKGFMWFARPRGKRRWKRCDPSCPIWSCWISCFRESTAWRWPGASRATQARRRSPWSCLPQRERKGTSSRDWRLGADDYITKPFSRKVLAARIRAVLRRKEAGPKEEKESLSIHDLVIHPGRHEVLVKGKPVELTFTEFGILHFLARRPGWVFTRSQIVDAVRGDEYFVTDRAVDVQIVGLRKKLGSAAKNIETVRGVGYRFKE